MDRMGSIPQNEQTLMCSPLLPLFAFGNGNPSHTTLGLLCVVTPASPSPCCDPLSLPWAKLCLPWSSLGQLRADSGPWHPALKLWGKQSRETQPAFETPTPWLRCKTERRKQVACKPDPQVDRILEKSADCSREIIGSMWMVTGSEF